MAVPWESPAGGALWSTVTCLSTFTAWSLCIPKTAEVSRAVELLVDIPPNRHTKTSLSPLAQFIQGGNEPGHRAS